MAIFVLTIVFYSSAAKAEMVTRERFSDLAVCTRLAADWAAQQQGLVRVISATCTPQ